MAVRDELIDLKFRIYDGIDICHDTYEPSTTILTLTERLVAEWPEGKEVMPKSVNDVKLIKVFNFWIIGRHRVQSKRNESENEKMISCLCTII
ncbi:hypothetical protein UlMin_024439 [Ulmus minor]